MSVTQASSIFISLAGQRLTSYKLGYVISGYPLYTPIRNVAISPRRIIASRILREEGAQILRSGLIPGDSMYTFSFRGDSRSKAEVFVLNLMCLQLGGP